MAIYNGTDRYVVYYNGQRYVDSLTKPKLANSLITITPFIPTILSDLKNTTWGDNPNYFTEPSTQKNLYYAEFPYELSGGDDNFTFSYYCGNWSSVTVDGVHDINAIYRDDDDGTWSSTIFRAYLLCDGYYDSDAGYVGIEPPTWFLKHVCPRLVLFPTNMSPENPTGSDLVTFSYVRTDTLQGQSIYVYSIIIAGLSNRSTIPTTYSVYCDSTLEKTFSIAASTTISQTITGVTNPTGNLKIIASQNLSFWQGGTTVSTVTINCNFTGITMGSDLSGQLWSHVTSIDF